MHKWRTQLQPPMHQHRLTFDQNAKAMFLGEDIRSARISNLESAQWGRRIASALMDLILGTTIRHAAT